VLSAGFDLSINAEISTIMPDTRPKNSIIPKAKVGQAKKIIL
jgi:hypothetical protein